MADTVVEWAEDEIKHAIKVLDQWHERFAANPADAFEWSKDAFYQAARLWVARTALEFFSTKPPYENPLKSLYLWARSETMRMAYYPETSTSPPSNFMFQQRLSLLARLVCQLEDAHPELKNL